MRIEVVHRAADRADAQLVVDARYRRVGNGGGGGWGYWPVDLEHRARVAAVSEAQRERTTKTRSRRLDDHGPR